MNFFCKRTIKHSVQAQGIGLHSGKPVLLCLKPASVGVGIVFVRSDLPKRPCVPMDAFLVTDTHMSSNLCKDGVRIGTVEHLLAAVAAMGIDDLIIEVSAAEMPVMEGSARAFFDLLTKAGIVCHMAPKQFIRITKKVCVEDGDKWAYLAPFDGGFSMDFQIDFSHPAIQSTPQKFRFCLSSENFRMQIAAARTFGFLKDLKALQAKNLAFGASLDNAVVLDDTKVVNKEGLLYKDEFVRHKMLDAVGDLFMIGDAIIGHFSAYKSGHALNNALVRKLISMPDSYEVVQFNKDDCPIKYYPADLNGI